MGLNVLDFQSHLLLLTCCHPITVVINDLPICPRFSPYVFLKKSLNASKLSSLKRFHGLGENIGCRDKKLYMVQY